MKLASPKYKDKIQKSVQVQFGGLRHTDTAGDGEFFDMKNLSSDAAPLLRTRAVRGVGRRLIDDKANAFGGYNGLYWTDGTHFTYERRGVSGAVGMTVEDGKKSIAHLNDYLIIMPDKMYIKKTGTYGLHGSLEATYTSEAGACCFQNGTRFGEAATANAVYCADSLWATQFNVGDALTISGCKIHPENNKTVIVRERVGMGDGGIILLFDENAFVLEGEDGTNAYTEEGAIAFTRSVPDMDIIFENDNRLWGCKGSTIYASKLGDPFNWNVFDGVETDAWSSPVLSEGDFTGGISYGGYPMFFKEKSVCKVYGTVPSEFRVMETAMIGVRDGCGCSLAVAGDTLFYLSRAGVCAYTGGVPTVISTNVFPHETLRNAVGGSDMVKYYLSCEDGDGKGVLLVYDTQRRMWHKEDDERVVGWAFDEGVLYFMDADGTVFTEGLCGTMPDGFTEEEAAAIEWTAEFGDFTVGSPNKKAVSKIEIRAEVEGTMYVYLRYDGAEWIKAGEIETQTKTSVCLPILPRRADHYHMKLCGTGKCTVFSVARSFYIGSEKR